MKKIICICLVILLALPIIAAEPKEKRDYSKWLPEAGDFSIGLGIDPLASFVGNMFNGSTNNGLSDLSGEALLSNQASVMGSYFITNQVELHVNIGFLFANNTNRYYVVDDRAVMLDPLSRQKVIDSEKNISNGGSFALGINYRIGKRAVQGVFGGGLIYGFTVDKTCYSYGNAITEFNQNPTTEFATQAVSSYMPYARPITSYNSLANHKFGLYTNIGVEWFVAPKIALGANINLNLIYTIGAQEWGEYEGWNTLTERTETFTDLISPGDRGFYFGIQNIGANLYVSFIF